MSDIKTGFDAIIHGALDSNVRIVTGVPGYPINEIMERFKLSPIKSEWSINEKVALEIALGSSVCGNRAMVLTKHVGMNVLADPLTISTTHTIGAGVVILVGDDPGAVSSQNEQDSRYYGLISEVPVFDPSTPSKLWKSILLAYELSEYIRAPVIIRTTSTLYNREESFKRLLETKVLSEFGYLKASIWNLTMRGKHQLFHKESYPLMREISEKTNLNTCSNATLKSEIGIISSGDPSYIVEDLKYDISHLSLGLVNPLPSLKIKEFVKKHNRILVVEETEPFIEMQLSLHPNILGKLTGHLPYGKIEKKDIRDALNNIHNDTVEREITVETLGNRGYTRTICEDCPYVPLYEVLKKIKNIPIAGDLGCSIYTASPPLYLISTAYSLGSAISVATGFGKKGIAVIGDFGLAHSGIQGLINAVFNKHDVLIIVLQNDIAAMTGGQKVPDLTDLIYACTKDVEIIDFDNEKYNIKEVIKETIKEKFFASGVSVILARGKCKKYPN